MDECPRRPSCSHALYAMRCTRATCRLSRNRLAKSHHCTLARKLSRRARNFPGHATQWDDWNARAEGNRLLRLMSGSLKYDAPFSATEPLPSPSKPLPLDVRIRLRRRPLAVTRRTLPAQRRRLHPDEPSKFCRLLALHLPDLFADGLSPARSLRS